MAARRTPRLVVIGASLAVGLAVVAIARRPGGSRRNDPAREVFLETRRERMRAARLELMAAPKIAAP
ncbi:MAG: hypothetical protein ABI317_15285 [Gaiellales bacterium]